MIGFLDAIREEDFGGANWVRELNMCWEFCSLKWCMQFGREVKWERKAGET